jgi:drug/metabolite transporter (DMT)-like permease
MNQLMYLLLWAWLMASSFIISGNMSAYASPLATSCFRFLLALLCIVPCLIISWRRTGLHSPTEFKRLFSKRSRLLHYVFISGTLVGFFIGLFLALESTTPLNTSVLYTLVPLMGVVIARVWLGELASGVRIFGFIVGSLGAVIVLLSNHSTQTAGSNSFVWHSGDSIYIGACFLLAMHVVSVQKWGRTLPALSGAFMIMLFGTLWLLPITLIWGNIDEVSWHLSGFWSNILYLTIFTTLLTFVLQQRLVVLAGATRLLAMSYTIPVWVACYTSVSQSSFSSLLSTHFISGLLCIVIALLLIDGTYFTLANRKRRLINTKEIPHGSHSTTR